MVGGQEDCASRPGEALGHQARIIAVHHPLLSQDRRIMKGGKFCIRALLPVGVRQMLELVEMNGRKTELL
ncbi:Uncharacterised protein [Mycobacterium tuberculosis]|nr:Uncharacterised protein [Mycobacterium tuberculosis]